MQITNNLNNDISAAPEWFNQAINIKPSEKILESEKGPLSYSIWQTESKNKNLLIFIHGTGAHKKWWYPIAPQFINYSNVIAIDLPGMGDSGFRQKYSIKDFGQCVISIIEKEQSNLDIDNIFIVGHSLGGQVAGYVASEEKELVSNLIMIDTFIRPPDWDPSQNEGGPLRMIKYYSDKTTILKRFRLLPQQECENEWFVRYIADIKKTYSDIMDFNEVKGAAHHVPLDKPLEIVDIIKKRLF